MPEIEDYIYDVGNWDVTHHRGDEGELLQDHSIGEIMEIGRLKSLPSKFAICNPKWGDDDCEEEYLIFDTKEEAQKVLENN